MPELKVEVNAVPIEEINQSVTRLRKMAAPGNYKHAVSWFILVGLSLKDELEKFLYKYLVLLK